MNVKSIAICLICLILLGCQTPLLQTPTLPKLSWPNWDFKSLSLRSQSPETDSDEFETKVDTPLIGEYTTIAGLNLITLEGVGLVTGLDGTGDDPPPSMYRTALLDDMKRRGVPNPNQLLRLPSTTLVIVRAYMPPLIKKGEPFDVEVRLPANSEATSLAGGWLMECYLSEQAIVPGRGILKGHEFAKAKGPVLISASDDEDRLSLAGVLQRGRVLGGGTCLHERDLQLFLRNDVRSVRNAKRIADRIGKRFHSFDKYGLKESMAEAKTDQMIVLKVHPSYKDNLPRYLQVVRSIAFRENDVARQVRMQRLKEELSMPRKSERASLQLEAIGSSAVPTLKTALKSSSLEPRFHASMALAYLGDAAGVKILANTVRDEPAFRVFGLAALATIDDPETFVELRNLMNETSAETRYGAYRALWTLDKYDPFIRGDQLNEQFTLHALQTEGDPLVHLTHRRHQEIVLFGADQHFHTPLAVRAGRHILVTAGPGANEVRVTKFSIDDADERRIVSTKISDVIEAAAELGASYPDVAGMLLQASRQENLPGPIAIDALPKSGRVYLRESSIAQTSAKSVETRVGHANMTPSLYDSYDDTSDQAKPREKLEDSAKDSGTASLIDVTDDAKEEQDEQQEPNEERLIGQKSHPWYKPDFSRVKEFVLPQRSEPFFD